MESLDFNIKAVPAANGQALPKEVVAVLPADPWEQLNLAHGITCRAYSQQVASLDAEVEYLRKSLSDNGAQVQALEGRLTSCQLELRDALDKAQQHAEAEARLKADNGALMATVRKLNRDVAKLEAFKRSLAQTLQATDAETQDDSLPAPAAFLATEALVEDAMHSAALHISNAPAYSHRNGVEALELHGGGQQAHASKEAHLYGAATNGSASPMFGSSLAASPQPGFALPDQAHQRAQHGGRAAPEPRSTPDQQRGGGGAYGSPLDAGTRREYARPGLHEQERAEQQQQQQQPVQATNGAYGSPVDLGRGGYSNAADLAIHGERHRHHPSYPEHGSSRGFAAQTPAAAPSDPYLPAGQDAPPNGHFPAAVRQPQQRTPPPPAYRPSTAETLCYQDSRHGTSNHGDGSAARREAHAGMHHERAAVAQQQRYASRPGSGQGTPASAPPPERLDGKEFFRRRGSAFLQAWTARARLSNEAFARFLGAIKELNAGRQSREDVLSCARSIFGARDADLYSSFEALLSRHLPGL